MFEAASHDLVLRILREGLLLALMVSAPLLAAMLLVGVLSGAFSSLTQIQDQTLGFVPKLFVAFVGVVLFGPYLGAQLVRFTVQVFSLIGTLR